MKFSTWSVFVCTILTSIFLQINATRKIDEYSTFNKILSFVKSKWNGAATHNDGRNHVFDYEDKEWKDFDKTPEYKKALKNYLDRVLSPRGMDAKAIHFKGVNIIALTPHKESSVEIDDRVNFITPHAHSEENDVKVNFKSLLDASNENIVQLTAPYNEDLNQNTPIVELKSIHLRNKPASDLKEKAKSAAAYIRNLFNMNIRLSKNVFIHGINVYKPPGRNGRKQDGHLVILRPRKRKNSKDDGSLRRTVFSGPGEVILGAPTRPEHLPMAQHILPGHTLLRPAKGMLKSAVKYPLRDVGGSEVYGNLNNLGITFGKTLSRLQYSDFRRSNDFLQILQKSIQNSRNSGKTRPLILIELDTAELQKIKQELKQKLKKTQFSEEEDSASEILDDLDTLYNRDNDPSDFRRKKTQKINSKYRNRGKYYLRKPGSDSDATDTESSSNERNPGNPYTLHKTKYKQNWMWNHKMDGTHMNVNPYAPNMNQAGPSGAELFFARKWWYFNQDDYKPLGRKR